MMDQIIKWIYIAYFNQDTMSVAGISEDANLASALQMMTKEAEFSNMFNLWNPVKVDDAITIRSSLNLVKKYSTCKNL